jgi:hypothetical protein
MKKGPFSPKELETLIDNTGGLEERVAILKKQLSALGYEGGVKAFELYEPDDYCAYYHEVW